MDRQSVRDRIRAAELARQQQEEAPVAPSSSRRGPKVALNQDEHVKEEFLKKGDGGWTKKLNVGQLGSFSLPRTVPAIQVTNAEPPALQKKSTGLSKKITVPGAFEASEDASKPGASGRRARPTIVSDSSKTTKKTPSKAKKSPSPSPIEDLLSSDIPQKSKRAGNRKDIEIVPDSSAKNPRRSRDALAASQVKQNEPKGSRESITRAAKSSRSPAAEVKKERKKTENGPIRVTRPIPKRRERLSNDEDLVDHPLTKSRSAGDPSEGNENTRPRPSLWSSFLGSKRRSIGDPPVVKPKEAAHRRSSSVDSAILSRGEKPPSSPRKELGFMEYISGKKLDHISDSALKVPKPPERMGYVRSRNSTGGYSEHFTRNKRYLRKPEDDEVLEYETSDRERRRRHSSWNDVVGQRKEEPWQVKFARELARR